MENVHVIHVRRSKGLILLSSWRFGSWVRIPYTNEAGEYYSYVSEADKYLSDLGFEFIGKAEHKNDGFLLISSTFKDIKS